MFKKFIETIVPYEPGRPIEEVERELGVRHVCKLASNENPLGPSPKAVAALRRAIEKVHLYPDGGGYYLKQKLSDLFGLAPARFVLGNGSNEIIELLARGFLSEGDAVLSSETTFLVYPLIAQSCGARFVSVPMKNFSYDLDGLLSRIDENTRLIFIANPNNPTGTYVSRKQVETFLRRVPDHVIVVFDEAYVDFVSAKDFPAVLDIIKSGRPNLVSLRTFSKSHGLAGLRIGYGMLSENFGNYLEKVRQPFNVNSLAQIAACAALEDRRYVMRSKQTIVRGREFLYRELKKLKLTFVRSQANFVLIDVKRDGQEVFEALLQKGIIVRSMKAYGLKNYIRVSIGTSSELRRFVKHMADLTRSKSSK